LATTATKATTKAAINILYGESDETTLASQSAEIRKVGHHVTTALNRQGVQDALRGHTFDLVILGSTLSKDDRHHLPYMVKKARPETKVLVMHAASRHHEVDAAIDANTSMQFVFEKIARLMDEALVSA
jgi:DNA-binding NtrC family response regulator